MTGRCILCLNEDVTLTSEHIFPEAIGGKICKDILCKSCNSNLGRFVDAPYLNQFSVKLARNAYELQGKTGNIPQPLSDTYIVNVEDDRPLKIKFDSDFKPRVIPSKPEVWVAETGKIGISLSTDAANIRELPEIITKILVRFFDTEAGKELGLSGEEQARTIQDATTRAAALESKSSPVGEIQGEFEVDFRKLYAEHVKVIYEICCIEFNGFCNSDQGKRLGGFLLAQFSNSPPEWNLDEMTKHLNVGFFHDSEQYLPLFKPFIGDKTLSALHIALVHASTIACSMLGMGCVFLQLDAPLKSNFQEDGCIYLNEIQNDGRAGIFTYKEAIKLNI